MTSLQPLLARATRDRAFAEELVEAGLARWPAETSRQGEIFESLPVGFFAGERVVFPIAGLDGSVVGFAARALGNEHPKYLYNRGFKRSEILYGTDRVLRDLRERSSTPDAFILTVAEGIPDALRLVSVERPAVAVLGSTLTTGQGKALGRLLSAARDTYSSLRVDLFLDPDEAGRKGTITAINRLLDLEQEHGPFDIRVIVPPNEAGAKLDPDAFLREMDVREAQQILEEEAVPALAFLAAAFMRRPMSSSRALSAALVEATAGERAMAARRIVDGADRTGLLHYLDQLGEDPGLATLIRSIRVFAGGADPLRQVEGPAGREERPAEEAHAALLKALALGRSTTARREYPFDDRSWDRLAIAASALYHVHAARLADEFGPAFPYLARHVPKGDGAVRRKCGPAAEDLLLQLYVLRDLLRGHAAEGRIPAVRFESGGTRVLTGPTARHADQAAREPVSFAYQIDMAVTEGEETPRREGLFRPYFECWRDFVDHLDRRLARMSFEVVHVLRLDIAGFYDNVRRSHVRSAILPSLIEACETLAGQGERLAPLLRPAIDDPVVRAETIAEFLLTHAFGYPFVDPERGLGQDAAPSRSNPDRGLPQGPDLSAYLANVALFELDALVSDEIRALDEAAQRSGGDEACGAAYARYVDDMVVICGDAATARRLQRRIEAYLSENGLRLNRKNATPPPMTRREARLWLTSNRTGLGFSGPLAETLPIAFFDPLAEAGDVPVDRKLALGLLQDPGLNAAVIYREGGSAERKQALARIKAALSAQELRYNDRVKAYRLLWLMAAADAQGSAIAARFDDLVQEVDAPQDGSPETARARSFALLDALERVVRLDARQEAAETPDETALLDSRDQLCRAGPHRLAEAAVALIFGTTNGSTEFLRRFDVAAQRLIILNAALNWIGSKVAADGLEGLSDGIAPLSFGSLLTTLRRYRPDAPRPELQLAVVERSGAAWAASSALQHAIVGAERWAAGESQEIDVDRLDLIADSPVVQAARAILDVWSGRDVALADRRPVHRDAAAALVNMTSGRNSVGAGASLLPSLFETRPGLLAILRGAAGEAAPIVLPRPPGLDLDATLLLEGAPEVRQLTLIEFGEPLKPEDARSVEGIAWRPAPELAMVGIPARAYRHDLDGFEPLINRDQIAARPEVVADTYEGLLKVLPPSHDERRIVPTVHGLFARERDGQTEYRIAAWATDAPAADGHAFVRHGSGLQVESVPERDASLWRFGWAVCDLFDCVDHVRADPAAEAEASVDHSDTIAHAILRRTMRRLVGPNRWGAGARSDGEPPSRIRRALGFLRAHGYAGDAATAATIAAAAYADGVMSHERIERPGQYWRPGGLAALLARAARQGARGLRRAAETWDEPPRREAPGLRRGTGGWFALADRVEDRAQDLRARAPADQDAAAVLDALTVLAAGCRLEGITRSLRRLTLDLCALDEATIRTALAQNGADDGEDAFAALLPDPGAVQALLGPEAVLVESDESALDRQVEALGDALRTIVLRGGIPQPPVTGLGWAVLAGTLLNLIDRQTPGTDLLRPAVPPLRDLPSARDALARLIGLLRKQAARKAEDEREILAVFDPYRPSGDCDWESAQAALLDLDAAAGLRVVNDEQRREPLQTLSDAEGRWIRLSWEGAPTVDVERWRVGDAFLPGDRGVFEARRDGEAPLFRLSVTLAGARVLSCDLLSQAFARTAFGKDLGGPIRRAADVSRPRAPRAERPSTGELRAPEPSSSEGEEKRSRASEGQEASAAEPEASGEAPRAAEDASPPALRGGSGGQGPPRPEAESCAHGVDPGTWRALIDDLRRGWSDRLPEPGMHRIALLQWDVSDTYYPADHIGARKGTQDGLVEASEGGTEFKAAELNRKRADDERLDGLRRWLSVAEHRRRAILEAALEACRTFQVEGLVLPEYSVRPETINWLADRLAESSHPKAVWAGTFRVPAGPNLQLDTRGRPQFLYGNQIVSGVEEIADFAAVVSCIYRVPGPGTRGVELPEGHHDADAEAGPQIAIKYRTKRHPSVAAGEIIRPATAQWEPLFIDQFWSPTHLQSFTLELVCSEIFLHASSSNIPGALMAAERAFSQFGMPRTAADTFKRSILAEIHDFARFTSCIQWPKDFPNKSDALSRGGDPQRTVMIVPAMTSRTADYHIFGQNHHLASRLITVFANAVCGEAVIGGSCFIGLDGWADMKVAESPYGDVGPGIFNVQKKRFGPLGRREAAMVIADVDPIHTVDSKPRPHFQQRPLRLVAHLPLIFATKHAKGEKAQDPGDHPVGERVIRREAMPKELREGRGVERTFSVMTFPQAFEEAWRAVLKVRDAIAQGAAAREHRDALKRVDDAVLATLKVLERFADDPVWLRERRAAYVERRHLYPERRFPPPVLADWIYVDDAWPTEISRLERYADRNSWDRDVPWVECPGKSDIEDRS